MIRLSGRKVRDGNLLCGLGGCGGRAVVGVQPLHGGVVAKVIESANPKFQEGDYLRGILDFCEYLVAPQGKGYSWEFVPASQELEIVDVSQVPSSYYLGVCGMSGLTAYVELKEIGQPKPGEEVLVTAAAGAVGPVVGQSAKIYGCCVVSSAGSDLKLLCLKSMSNWINLNAVGNHLHNQPLSNVCRQSNFWLKAAELEGSSQSDQKLCSL